MPIEVKCKIHELAKDLNIASKELVELLKEKSKSGKKYTTMTVIDASDISIVMDTVTKKYAVSSFDEYLASAQPIVSNEGAFAPEAKEEPAAAPAEEKKEVREEKKPEEKTQEAKKPEKTQGAAVLGTVPTKPAAQKQNTNSNANKQQNAQKPQQRQARPGQKKQESEVVVGANVTSGAEAPKTRIVDTRTVQVTIDKYNTKYDDMAHAKAGARAENTQNKQKLNQKSQQYRKPHKSNKRETEQERLKRIKQEREKRSLTIQCPPEIVVSDLAARMKVTAAEVVKSLFMTVGVMATVNDTIDFDTAYLVATEFNVKVEPEVIVSIEERIIDDSEDTDENLIPRSPVVCVMGHVDHGKTSLLDAIRSANVTAGEAGGITQHIGAYRVAVGDGEITFLDTPGHEAFTTMRARGAMATDIAILVVAADDGIMPQTVEAINHAKAANVSVIVAINKMDKPTANPDQVKQQLTEYNLVPEEWGGDVICVPVSAKTHAGIDDLLENVMLVAEMKELRANPDRAGKGIVIEARLDKGRGPIATVLVQNGTLRAGDIIVAGTTIGRVRAMTNDKGEKVEAAGPSFPVEITGLDEVPTGGDIFNVVSDERLGRELVEQRKNDAKEEQFRAQTRVTLDNLFSQMQSNDMKELKIIVKADVQGSVEAVRQSLEKLSNEEVRVSCIHCAVGAIRESDVSLADASNAIIVGFNVRPDPVAQEYAVRQGVDMRLYRVIYECIEEIESAMKGMLAPKTRVVDLGRSEVRQVFKVTGVGTIAGSYVVQGKIQRSALIRVVRDGIVIAEDKIDSLRRFKDDVKEVAQGYECGIGLEKFNDIKEGDFLEAFIIEEYRD